MAYNKKLADRIRDSLSHLRKVDEKEMFRGITFMVNDKMCVGVSGDEMMCRIDPELFEKAVEKKGARPVIMRGKQIRGYLYINEDGIRSKKDFDYWVNLCLEFNKKAKSSKKEIVRIILPIIL